MLQGMFKKSADMPQLLRVGEGGNGFANLSFILGCTSVILARRVHMNPRVLLESTSQNFPPVSLDTKLFAHGALSGAGAQTTGQPHAFSWSFLTQQ